MNGPGLVPGWLQALVALLIAFGAAFAGVQVGAGKTEARLEEFSMQTNSRLDRIEAKLDRAIERRAER